MPARMSGDSTVPPLSGDGPEITARWGSQSTMRAPMPISLSTKKSRDSNIFSNTSSMPGALRGGHDRGGHDVRRERRPGSVLQLGHVAAEVGSDPALLVGAHDEPGPLDPWADAQALEAEERAAEVFAPAPGRS